MVQVHVPPLSTVAPLETGGLSIFRPEITGFFILFGGLAVIALGCFYRKVPEIKGSSLRELEQQLVGSAVSPEGR